MPRISLGGLPVLALLAAACVVVPPRQMGGPSAQTPVLENTHWRLLELAGQPVPVAADRREPYFMLVGAEKLMQGFAGCNRMSGGYESAAQNLKFGPIISTKMACLDEHNPENAFLKALESTSRWSIAGEQLELYDASGALLARLKARTNPSPQPSPR